MVNCYTHVRFNAPNINSQPFVLRTEAEMEDISARFGTHKKSWSFGNLSITPLICSSYSKICSSQIYKSNKLDLHHTWNDDCISYME